jgi:hypothetical protein
MITNRRPAGFLVRIGCFTLFGALAATACSSGGDGGPATAGTNGHGGTTGTAGASGTTGGAGTGAAGTTGSGGNGGNGGNVGSTGSAGNGGNGGNGGSTGAGGAAAGTSGATGGTGGTTGGSAGEGGATGGVGGMAGRGGTNGGTAGRGGTAGGGVAGRGGSGGNAGSGGATNCAGHAVSFSTNVAGNNDPAMARVNVPSNTDLPTGNASRTIEFWAYVLSTSWSADTNTTFFYGSNNRNNDGFGLDFGATSGGIGTIDPFTNGSTDPQGDNKSSGVQANTSQWVHFAMTWDGTNLKAFVNGVEKVSVPITTMLHTGTTALTIGGYPPAFFNGQIDEFRIWTVARTAAQISSTMGKTLAGDEPNLVGYWKFDETSGTTAVDSVTTAGHTAHAGTLMANSTGNLPTFVPSTAPISCP